MKVLFHTYDLAFYRMGGGERVMLALQSELTALGIVCNLFDPWQHRVEEYDLVHSFATRESDYWIYHAKNFSSIPLFVTPTLPVLETAGLGLFSRCKKKYFDFQMRSRYSIPDLFLAATNPEAQALKKRFHLDDSKIRILPNGISSHITKDDLHETRQKLGLLSDQPIILCAGRFEPVKNQLLLLQALLGCENIHAIFIGDADPGQKSYLQKCKRLAVEIMNRRNDIKISFYAAVSPDDLFLPMLYAAADVYVQPSIFETFGISALEAYAAGCSMALTKNMASHELFTESFFFSPDSTAQCSQSIRAALAKKRSVGRRVEVMEKFSWNRIALELRALYAEVLGNGTHRTAQ